MSTSSGDPRNETEFTLERHARDWSGGSAEALARGCKKLAQADKAGEYTELSQEEFDAVMAAGVRLAGRLGDGPGFRVTGEMEADEKPLPAGCTEWCDDIQVMGTEELRLRLRLEREIWGAVGRRYAAELETAQGRYAGLAKELAESRAQLSLALRAVGELTGLVGRNFSAGERVDVAQHMGAADGAQLAETKA